MSCTYYMPHPVYKIWICSCHLMTQHSWIKIGAFTSWTAFFFFPKQSLYKYISMHCHILHFQNWFLYICSSVVLPPLLDLCKELPDSKTCDAEPLLFQDTPVHTPNPACLVSASTNAGELLELRLDSISTISSWKISSQILKAMDSIKLWCTSLKDSLCGWIPISAFV